jgi:soluble lytic murein transglycosylase
MAPRHTLVYLLFFAVLASLAVLHPPASHSTPSALAQDPVPPDALDALNQGRYLRASQILGAYLAERTDATPSALMLAARAAAGWGDWERVRELLEGQSWLDRVGAGYGWSLLGRSQVELGQYPEGSASLARFLTVADTAGSREQGLAQIKRAEALKAQKEYAGAVAAYDEAAGAIPQIADWIAVFAASAAADAGDTAAVRQRLEQVDTVLAREWSWRTLPRARLNASDAAGALAVAESAAARVPGEARRAAAWSLVAMLRREVGDEAGARAAHVWAIEAAPRSSAALDAARSLSELGGLTREDQLRVGRVYLRHGNVERGAAGLNAYIAAGGGTAAERARLRYDLANAYFSAGKYRDAEKALLAVASSAGDRRVAADALYTAARAQYRDGRHAVARATLSGITRDYADQPAAVRAAYLAADLEHDELNLARAAELYRQAIRLAPSGEVAASARMRLAGVAFAQGRYDEALREFEDYRTTHRSGPPYQQATYWSAQALARVGRTDEARARLVEVRRLDPFSYYGGLAAQELGDDAWHERLERSPPDTDRYDDQVARALARVDLLREIGWEEAASFEMDRVRRHFACFDGALYTLAEQLNERGFTSAGVNLGREIQQREGAWNLRLLKIVYPFPFENIVVAEARERGVDPFLAAALIRQESMFNPRARSGAGALGLMQVMPRTGQTLARALRVPRFKPELLLTPEVNIHLGMQYLADQLADYGERIDAVLAAYNAGPTRLSRWQKFPEYHDRRLFAERIPFDETRDYVRIVQNNRRIYAALYGAATEQPTDR